MEVESGPVVIEVRNILYVVTEAQFRTRILERVCRLGRDQILSLSMPPRTGKATVELASQAVAELALASLNTTAECSFQGRGLRAELVAGASQPFVQTDGVDSWTFADESAGFEPGPAFSNKVRRFLTRGMVFLMR